MTGCPPYGGHSDDGLNDARDIVAELVYAQHKAENDAIDRKIYADAPESIKARLSCFNDGNDT